MGPRGRICSQGEGLGKLEDENLAVQADPSKNGKAIRDTTGDGLFMSHICSIGSIFLLCCLNEVHCCN